MRMYALAHERMFVSEGADSPLYMLGGGTPNY